MFFSLQRWLFLFFEPNLQHKSIWDPSETIANLKNRMKLLDAINRFRVIPACFTCNHKELVPKSFHLNTSTDEMLLTQTECKLIDDTNLSINLGLEELNIKSYPYIPTKIPTR